MYYQNVKFHCNWKIVTQKCREETLNLHQNHQELYTTFVQLIWPKDLINFLFVLCHPICNHVPCFFELFLISNQCVTNPQMVEIQIRYSRRKTSNNKKYFSGQFKGESLWLCFVFVNNFIYCTCVKLFIESLVFQQLTYAYIIFYV
jgi:hypothetical protein